MKVVYTLFFLMIFLGCKTQKYQLENNSTIQLIEAYFTTIPPAIADETPSTQIFVKVKESEDYKLNGLYFDGRYISKKRDDNNFSIITFYRNKSYETDIPFQLSKDEMVLEYTENGILKYVKFPISKKRNWDNIPR